VAERLFWSGPAGTRPQSDHPAAFKIGGFEITVAAALSGAKLPPAMVNPRQIRDCARAFGRLAKTHALDAQVIALFAERVRPEPRPRSGWPSWSRAGARSLS
jgi:hypothetical protein